MGTLISVASQIAPSSSVYNTSKTLTGSNATVAVPIFRITGSMRFTKLYGIVTTVLGSNHTGSFFRINDQTAQVNITSSTGTTISSAPVGSLIIKKGLAAALVILSTSVAGRVLEPASTGTVYLSEFVVIAKNGANTDIEYVYTTTETPTTGAIQFFVEAQPISADGIVTAL